MWLSVVLVVLVTVVVASFSSGDVSASALICKIVLPTRGLLKFNFCKISFFLLFER